MFFKWRRYQVIACMLFSLHLIAEGEGASFHSPEISEDHVFAGQVESNHPDPSTKSQQFAKEIEEFTRQSANELEALLNSSLEELCEALPLDFSQRQKLLRKLAFDVKSLRSNQTVRRKDFLFMSSQKYGRNVVTEYFSRSASNARRWRSGHYSSFSSALNAFRAVFPRTDEGFGEYFARISLQRMSAQLEQEQLYFERLTVGLRLSQLREQHAAEVYDQRRFGLMREFERFVRLSERERAQRVARLNGRYIAHLQSGSIWLKTLIQRQNALRRSWYAQLNGQYQQKLFGTRIRFEQALRANERWVQCQLFAANASYSYRLFASQIAFRAAARFWNARYQSIFVNSKRIMLALQSGAVRNYQYSLFSGAWYMASLSKESEKAYLERLNCI